MKIFLYLIRDCYWSCELKMYGDKLNSLQIILAARKINSRSYATTTQIIQQITNDTQEWR